MGTRLLSILDQARPDPRISPRFELLSLERMAARIRVKNSLELLSNNVMEPWLYGSSTGVTPIALIVAAVFWTWLWGPVGLILSTPLTVCLVVIERHVPCLSFLSILLSDEEALTPAEDCYHRLLTVSEQDELEFVEAYLKVNSLTALYDSVFIPVIIATETDHRLDLLDDEQRLLRSHRRSTRTKLRLRIGNHVVQRRRFTFTACPRGRIATNSRARCSRSCCNSKASRRRTLRENLTAGELLDLVEESGVDAACISVVSPSTVIQARYLCVKLRARYPQLKIVIGLWATTQGATDAARRLRNSGADEVVTTLEDAVVQLAKHAPTLGEQMMPAPGEESASAYDVQHDLDISQAKGHPSEAPVGTSVNDRYETWGKKRAAIRACVFTKNIQP